MLNLTRKNVNLLHALLIGPLLIHVGMNKGNVDKRWFQVMLVLGLLATAFHSLRFLGKL